MALKKILIIIGSLICLNANSQSLKIGQLPVAAPLTGVEILPVTQNYSTRGATVNQLKSFLFPIYSGTTIKYLSDSAGVFSWRTVSGGGGGGSSTWGGITGTLSSQTDLQTALNLKYNTPTGTTSQYVRGDGTLATLPSGTTFNYQLITASSFTATTTNKYIECSVATTITLPTAVGNVMTEINVKNIGTGNVTVICTGSQTIDGSVNKILTVQNQSQKYISNGTNWKIY